MRTASPWPSSPQFRKPKNSSGAMWRQAKDAHTGWPCATARARNLSLIHVLDVGLVKQYVGFADAVHLQATFVVPLDDSVQRLAILQHEDHRGLGLHLLYVVEILGVGLVGRHGFLLRPARRSDLLLDLVQRWTDEFSVRRFHWKPSLWALKTWPAGSLTTRAARVELD